MVKDLITNEGGSGTGHSYWKGWHGCERAAYLRETQPELVSSAGADYMQAGTVFHALCEMQERNAKHVDTSMAIKGSQIQGTPLQEGVRVFRQYRTKCGPGFWGSPIAIEDVLGASDEDYVQTFEYFGFPHNVTIKPDLVVKVDSLASKRVNDTFKQVIRPGNYLLDYKTVAGIPSNTDSYFHSIQFKLYQLVWNLLRPEFKLDGALVVFASRAKAVRVELLRIPAVTDTDREIVTAFLLNARIRRDNTYRLAEAKKPLPVNNTYCHQCPWFKNYNCERF